MNEKSKEQPYAYFNRDISWLSFNYRVLLESEDVSLPIYERIKFLAIHASNLEEFYEIRVAEHRNVILQKIRLKEDPSETEQILEAINTEVTRQQQEFFRIFQTQILPELERKNIILYMNDEPKPEHRKFIKTYFEEEIYPFLQPVLLLKNEICFFIRDKRLYQFVQLRKNKTDERFYSIIKTPYAKIPRFIELPPIGGKYYYMFAEDVLSANLQDIFTGYTVEGCYNVKVSRDADILLDEDESKINLLETIKKEIRKRKIGELSRFVYDKRMPSDYLQFIREMFHIQEKDLIPDNRYLNLEDLLKLPNPVGKELKAPAIVPIRIPELDQSYWLFPIIRKKDIFLYYPYHTFNYFIRFLTEASANPNVEEIMITQYRVAEDSEIINNLINAAKNGKKITVFVELKARFDEANNLITSQMMKDAGINIIYSIPGLKVHAKVALVIEKTLVKNELRQSYAYLSTGNFNEKTAKIYSDMGIFTSNRKITSEIRKLFGVLETRNTDVKFNNIWVAQYNMIPNLKEKIHREIKNAKKGKKAYIVLKMNGLQDDAMIDELYKASEAGVKIDLIIRGISCIIPDQPYSKNIRVIRIVDMFLEHSRVWYFYNGGEEDVYITSADWMNRNLYHRIETAFPVSDKKIKQTIIKILKIQLSDNVKACLVDDQMQNIFKNQTKRKKKVRAQQEIYKLLTE
ncbi:MAG: polyphosphate kinase 1 [Candidatus Azobacteroides sp.]|nr:polyphosphate kinase 1 [Candidatus Azobacteroides sp.]